MKSILLSALLGVGIVAAISQALSGSEAARTPQRDPLVHSGAETFKANSAAPTPTPAGGLLRIPLKAETYPLVCRGGGSLVRVGGGLVIGTPPAERNIGFVFTRGTKPAGEELTPRALAPGECSWVDRGMRADEPDRVSQHIEEDSESLRGKLAPENRWYEGLQSKDRYWTFMVYNNGRGQLIAISARPNVPPPEDLSPTARVPTDLGEIKRPRSYPLVCRGSESLEIAFAPSIRSIGFTFTRGTRPAGEGLNPGECSWVDRGMHADEPDRLSQQVEASWESLTAAGTLAPENRWYEELHSSRKSWTFMVFNSRSVLHVTSARPNG